MLVIVHVYSADDGTYMVHVLIMAHVIVHGTDDDTCI